MSDQFAVVRGTLPVGLGNTLDLTSAKITETVTFAVVLISGATADDGAPETHARGGVGFVSFPGSTIQNSFCNRSRNGVSVPNNLGFGSSDFGWIMATGTASTTSGRITFSAIAGGVRATVSEALEAGFNITVLIGAGSANAKAGATSATTSSASVTGIGFAFDSLLVLGTGGNLGSPFTAVNDCSPGFGAVINAAGLPQMSIVEGWESVTNPTDCDGSAETDRAGGAYNASVAEIFSVTAVGSDGWTHISDAGTAHYTYLAIKFSDAGRKFGVAMETLPSGTGVSSFTGLGFQPEIALLGANLLAASDTPTDGATVATFMWGVFDAETGSQGSAGMETDENETLNTTSGSICDGRAIHLADELGADAVVAIFSATVAGGFSLDFTTATTGRMFVFGIGYPAAFAETVEIGDAFLAPRIVFQIGETVEISEAFGAFTSFLPAAAEIVEVQEGAAGVVFTITGAAASADPRGRTVEAGSVAGMTVEGGAEFGATAG